MTYADSVLAAIQYSDGPKGVSLAAIRKYFTAETTLDPKSVHLTKALKKLEATSKIIKVTSASYTMTVMAVQNTKPPTVSTSKPAGKRAKSVPMPPPPPADDDDNEEEEEEEVQGDIEVLGPLDDDEVLRIGEVAIVESSSGGQYEVVRDSATTWHCTCKSFRFCKKENWVDGERTCKHLEGVRSGEIEPLDIIPASKPPIAPIAPIAPTKKSSKKSTKKSAGGDDGVPFSFSALSAEKIKDCLRLNDQLLKGNKGEIIERADERYANGALARCPECGGGKFNLIGNGPRWECPGFHDGDKFHYCRNSTTTPERLPFEIPTELHGLIPPGPTETQRKNAAVVPVAMPMDAD